MNRKSGTVLVVVTCLLFGIITFFLYHARENTVQVETRKVAKQDIASVVTASGEIKPKTIMVVGRNANEPIVHFYVKEGDKVKKGQKLAELQNPQPPFDVKNVYTAREDGTVTGLTLHDGEAISTGALAMSSIGLMSIIDPNAVAAELSVDETDIFKIKLGQKVEVTLDAMSGYVFQGKITQIGQNAIIRSTGLAVSQAVASNQEARDFKVVVTLENPPRNIRSGLSATGKITTGFAHNVLTVPISALTTRPRNVLHAEGGSESGSIDKAEAEIVGVFVITAGQKAEFRPVKTGLMSATDAQITDGLRDGEEIVTGSYRVLRTLRTGAKVNPISLRMNISE